MTDFNPWGSGDGNPGVDIDAAYKAAREREEMYLDLDHATRSAATLDLISGSMMETMSIAPQLATELASQPGVNAATVFDELNDFNQSVVLEHHRVNWETNQQRYTDYETQKQIWEDLPRDIRAALEADGVQAPVDPHPGGIDIPFTSFARDLASKVGIGSPGQGDFQIMANTDNALTRTLQGAGQGVQAGVSEGIGSPLALAFKTMDSLEQHLISRPLTVGEMKNEETGLDSAVDWLSDNSGVGVVQGLISPAGSLIGGVQALVTGDAHRLYNLTQDNRGTFSTGGIAEAEELLNGDQELLVIAEELARTGDWNAAAEELSGEAAGTEANMAAFRKIMELVPPDGEENDFSRAVNTLRYNKIDFQNVWAEQAGVEQTHGWHGVTAGGYELGVLAVLDPTMVIGKANRIRKIVQYGVRSGHIGNEVLRVRQLARIARLTRQSTGKIDDASRIRDAAAKVRAGSELGVDPSKLLDGEDLRNLVIGANKQSMSRVRESLFARLTVSPESQLKYAAQVDETMDKIARVAQDFGRSADELGYAPYTFADLRREAPKTRYFTTQIREGIASGKIDGTRDSVWDMLADGEAWKMLGNGSLGRDARLAVLPRVNKQSQLASKVKMNWNNFFDMSRRYPGDVRRAIEQAAEDFRLDKISVDEMNAPVKEYLESRSMFQGMWESSFGLRTIPPRLFKHVPREKYINVGRRAGAPIPTSEANRGIDEFERMLNMGDLVNFSPSDRDYYLNAFIQGNQGERMEIVKTAVAEMTIRAGIFNDTDEALTLLEKYGLGWNQHFATTAVSSDVEKLMDSTRSSLVNHTAIWDSGLAEHVAIPDFKQLNRATRHTNAVRTFGSDAFDFVDAQLSRFWKPSVILRVGFISRAAGEETVSYILRYGMRNYMHTQFGRRWATGMIVDPVTGNVIDTQRLSPFYRRVRASGQQMKKWAGTRNEDLIQQVLGQGSDVAGRLEMDRLLKTIQDTRLGPAKDELLKIKQAKVKELLEERIAERGFRTRALNGVGDWATKRALDWSPRAYKRFHPKGGLPYRRLIAATVFGDLSRFRSGALRPMSLRPLSSSGISTLGELSSGYDDGWIVMANEIAMNNESVQIAMANGLGNSWAPYAAEGTDALTNINNVAQDRLTQTVTYGEKTNWRGKVKQVPMQRSKGPWQVHNGQEQAAREAVGFAFYQPATGPVVRDSGALTAMHHGLGPATTAKLQSIYGDEYMETIQALTTKLADDIKEYEDLFPWPMPEDGYGIKWDINDDIGQRLRQSLVNGDPWPMGYHPDLDKLADESQRIKSLFYPDDTLLREQFRPLGEAMDEVQLRMQRYQGLPGYQETLESYVRLQQHTGVKVVTPLQEDMVRFYGVSIRPRNAARVRALNLDQRALVEGSFQEILRGRGIREDDIERATNQLIGNTGQTDWLDAVVDMSDTQINEYIPASNLLFSDPDLAQDIADAYDQALKKVDVDLEMQPEMEAMAAVGMVDIHRHEFGASGLTWHGADEWQNASLFSLQDPGMITDFNRLDETKNVEFVETIEGQWMDRDEWAAMGDMQPELSGNVQMANGQSEWAARTGLANLRRAELEQLFISDETGDMLNEATGHLFTGSFEPHFHLDDTPITDLPRHVAAPDMVDIKTLGYDRVVAGLFQGVIDPAMQGIIRTPHWMGNFASQVGFMDEYYQMTTNGPLNDRVLDFFGEMGVDDDIAADLLDNIHYLFRSNTLDDDPSDMAKLVAALGDERVSAEDGVDIFQRSLVGTTDRLVRTKEDHLELLTNQFEMSYGRPPTPLQEELMDTYLDDIYTAAPAKPADIPVNTAEIDNLRTEIEDLRRAHVPPAPDANLADLQREMAEIQPQLRQIQDQRNRVGRDPNKKERELLESRLLEQKRIVNQGRTAAQDERLFSMNAELRELKAKALTQDLGEVDLGRMANLETGIATLQGRRLDELEAELARLQAQTPSSADQLRAIDDQAAPLHARKAELDEQILKIKSRQRAAVDPRIAEKQKKLDELLANRKTTTIKPPKNPRRIPNKPARDTRLEDIKGQLNDIEAMSDEAYEEIARNERLIRFSDNMMNQTTKDATKREMYRKRIETAADDIEAANLRIERFEREFEELSQGKELIENAISDITQMERGTSTPFFDDLMTQAEARRSANFDKARIRGEWENLQRWAKQRNQKYQESVEQGAVRATDMTVEFIDDHRFRSQFQQTVGNLIPFWFAQEQFIKRQVRMLVDSPESIRRASLLMNFGRASGIIDTDAEGNEIVVYPGSRYATHRFVEMVGHITGVPAMAAVAQPLSGAVEYQLPGYSGVGPGNYAADTGFGPLVGASTAFLAETFPELEPLDRMVHSEISEERQWWEHFMPTSVNRIITATGIGYFDSGRYAAAQMDAIQMAAALDLEPAEIAPPQEWQDYHNRVRNFTRIILATNAVFYLGSPLPTGNNIKLDNTLWTQEWQDIVMDSHLPREEAMALFLERNPDATPWTVFKSTTNTGAYFEQDSEAYQFLTTHADDIDDNPLAWAWFLEPPTTGEESDYNRRAANEAYELELRDMRTPESFMQEIVFAENAGEYYGKVDEMERLIYTAEGAENEGEVKYLKEQLSAYKEGYKLRHPIFADMIGRNRNRREAAKKERDRVLDMRDELPTSEHIDKMLDLMEDHRTFNRYMDQVDDSNPRAAEIRDEYRFQFLQAATMFTTKYPSTRGYFNANIRWDNDITSGGADVIFEIEAITGQDL